MMNGQECAEDDELLEIQRLQHHDLDQAQARAQGWLTKTLSHDVTDVRLNPQPTSLNSFNGVAVVGGRELFFKSHTEPDSTISEYYNSTILHEAGYNIVLPTHSEHRSGQQIAFYPVIDWPVVFDLARSVERDEPSAVNADQLISSEQRHCAELLHIYRRTAATSSAAEHGLAPVHQLFWHRIVGGRFKRFYEGCSIPLNGEAVDMSRILQARWTINGIEQTRTLGDLIDEAVRVLDPSQEARTVVGHGDAHYGNVFLEAGERFLFFDPAFAGRHTPMLDVVKPLFHNVFAQWMYFPDEKASEISLSAAVDGTTISVQYRNAFSALRRSLLETKQRSLIEPLLAWLTEEDALPHGTRPLELALMCCPLLTMNLADASRFPPPVSWLGLALAVQMGNWDSQQRFGFDRFETLRST